MKHALAAFLATVLGADALSAARDAHALGPLDLELGAELGMGTNPTGSAPNPLALGVGVRGGVAVVGFYGGLRVMYYLGSSLNESVGNGSWEDTPGPHYFSQHTLLYGIDGGYGIKLLGLLTLRAQVGVGKATTTGRISGQLAHGESGGSSNSTLYLEPGLTAMVSLGTWFVGADVNALVLTAFEYQGDTSTDIGLTLHGQVGVMF